MLHRQLAEQLPGALQNSLGNTRKPRYVNSVAAIGAAFDDAMQEDHLVFPLTHRDIEVLHALEALGEVGQLMVMRREKRAAARFGGDVLRDRPRQRETVKRTRVAADLVENDQAAIAC